MLYLQSEQPLYLHNLLTILSNRATRSSDITTLQHPPVHSLFHCYFTVVIHLHSSSIDRPDDVLFQICHEDNSPNAVSRAAGRLPFTRNALVYEPVLKEVGARKAAEHKANSLQRLLNDLRVKKVSRAEQNWYYDKDLQRMRSDVNGI